MSIPDRVSTSEELYPSRRDAKELPACNGIETHVFPINKTEIFLQQEIHLFSECVCGIPKTGDADVGILHQHLVCQVLHRPHDGIGTSMRFAR
jgi:hypothetical protein